MRPCIKEVFMNGLKEKVIKEKGNIGKLSKQIQKDHFEFYRYAIIGELERLKYKKSEIKEILRSWNNHCKPKLGEGHLRAELIKFVDWYIKKKCHVSCDKIREKGFCLYPDGDCPFQNRCKPGQMQLPFLPVEAEKFLKEHYSIITAYIGKRIILTLFSFMNETGYKKLYIGLREIRNRIHNDWHYWFDPTQIRRAMHKLEEAGMLEIEPGESGSAKKKANGYRFLNWS